MTKAALVAPNRFQSKINHTSKTITTEPVVRGIIKIHYYCNSFCVFCHSEENKIFKANDHAAMQKIQSALDMGINQVLFSGGEPTIYPRFKQLLEQTHSLGVRCGIISNGRKLADRNFAAYLLDKDVSYYYLSLHSHLAATHDIITESAGSFDEAVLGFQNLLQESQRRNIDIDFTVNCVVTMHNIEQLEEFAQFMQELKIPRIKFSFPQHKGRANDEGMSHPSLEYAGNKISQALRFCQSINLEAYHDGLPFCFLSRELIPQLDNLQTHRIFYMTEIYEDRWHLTDEGRRYYDDSCRSCSYYKVCDGILQNSIYEKVKPLSKKIADHVLLKPTKITLPDVECLREQDGDYLANLPRRLYLRQQDAIDVYEFDESFFKLNSFDDIRLKGQFFYDDENSLKLHRQQNLLRLKKIMPSSLCQSCAEFSSQQCSGIYQKSTERFDVGFNKLRQLLASLTGSILEVGCGSLLLSDLLCENNPHYFGIDCDADIIAENKKCFGKDCFAAVDVYHYLGDLKKTNQKFNAILLVGSYNHLIDIDSFYQQAIDALTDDGVIYIFENNLFALLCEKKSEEKSEQNFSDKDQDGYEHYRNHSLDEAVAVAQKFPLKILKQIDITPNNNFWVLILQK